MNTALVRSLLALLAMVMASVTWAQSPTPFSSPSLLPSDGEYPQRQAYPSTSAQTFHSASMPANATRYTSPSYYNRGIPPMTYADAAPQAADTPQATTPDIGVPADPLANCDSESCWGEPVCCEPACGPAWYAAASGLLFTRNQPRFSQLSFDDTNLIGQVLSTDSGLGQWDAGPQVQFGWYIDPCWALEFTYWGLYGEDMESSVYAANLVGNLNTVFDFSPLNIGATNVNDLFDAAQAHRVRRDYDVNNFELNLIGGRMPGFDGNHVNISYLGGVRYLRFAEEFQYASADATPIFGADLANEAYYDIDVRNNLWGVQLGGRADWHVTSRFGIYVATKFGIYANDMKQHSRISNATGIAVVGPGNPLAGDAFEIASDKTLTSFLGELDLGLSYQITPRWSAVMGYRAMALSGLAYATDQIPSNMADLPGVADVDGNADLILHGGYAGVILGW